MKADHFRDRAAVWRQRATERTDSRERDADLRLAEEYERLALSLSPPDAAVPLSGLAGHDMPPTVENGEPNPPMLAGDWRDNGPGASETAGS